MTVHACRLSPLRARGLWFTLLEILTANSMMLCTCAPSSSTRTYFPRPCFNEFCHESSHGTCNFKCVHLTAEYLPGHTQTLHSIMWEWVSICYAYYTWQAKSQDTKPSRFMDAIPTRNDSVPSIVVGGRQFCLFCLLAAECVLFVYTLYIMNVIYLYIQLCTCIAARPQ